MSRTIPVSSHEYDEKYFLTCCEGYTEYIDSKGKNLSSRLQQALDSADVKKGMRTLDIGCGRGEIISHCAMKGALAYGLDYARTPVVLANECVKTVLGKEYSHKTGLSQADATRLPFRSSSFDRIFMLDFVEHLYSDDLIQAMNEAYRVLKPEGKIVIHTQPNRWYFEYGYYIYRLISKLKNGKSLPKNPRTEYAKKMHVNEQSILDLYILLGRTGFKKRIWLAPPIFNYIGNNPIIRIIFRSIYHYPLKAIFSNEIYAIAEKGGT